MLGKRIINTATGAGAACTTDTVQILGDTSCVAYYKMSDATDETGSYDGTPTNVNFNVAGKFGNAGDFNGSSGYIDTNAKIPASLDFSVSFWMKSSDTSTGNHYIFGTKGNYVTSGWFISNDAGYIRYGEGNGVDNATSQSSPSIVANGNWNHVVVTRASGGTINMYVNGSRVITDASVGTYFMTSSTWAYDLHIGRYAASSILFYDGQLDQVRIFDRAITANEVTTLYNEVYCQPTIVPTDYFNTVLYTGTGSGSKSVTGVGFQPDLVWGKARSAVHPHILFDSVRGENKQLSSNDTTAEVTRASDAYLFDLDGFTVTTAGNLNNAFSYVAWNFKAGGDDVQNTDGTITSQVSANVDAGFSVVTWTGSFNTGQTIGHGLGQAPKIIMARTLDRASNLWYVSHPEDNTKSLILSSTAAQNSDLTWVKGENTFGANWTGTSYRWLAYCFHSVDGMSKIGSYVGVGSGNTVNVVTGFRPAMIIIKRTDSIEDWKIIDNKRDFANSLEPNESIAEEVGNNSNFSSHSNGFTIGDPHGDYNASGGTYIYMAFAEENVEPQPVLANSFNTVTYTGTGTTGGNTLPVTGFGFQPDLVWVKNRDVSVNHYLYDSVRGTGTAKALHSNTTSSESTASAYAVNGGVSSFLPDGFTAYRGTDNTYQGTNMNGQDYVAWAWKASNESTINQEGSITSIVSANPAAGFSIVKYQANATQGATIGHGLSSPPEMIITKEFTGTRVWCVYHKDLTSSGYYLELNTSNSELNSLGTAYAGVPNSSTYSVGNSSVTNDPATDSYIAYCFHSVAGYQSVGSYSGGNSGSSNVITTGFKPSFLMVKRTDQAGDAWQMFDSIRGGGDTFDNYVQANSSAAEVSYNQREVTFTNNGFYWTYAESGTNISGGTYIYLAIKAN